MRWQALAAIVVLAVGGCSGGGVSQEDFDGVAGERNVAQVRLTETQVALSQAEAQVMTLEEKLVAAEIRAEISDRLRGQAEADEAAQAFWEEFLAGYDEAWSSEDLNEVLPFYARDATYERPVQGTLRRGREDVFVSFANFLALFDGYRTQTEDLAVVDAGTAFVMWRATARDLDGALVLLSGGTRLELDEDGLIVRHVDYATFP